MYKIVVLTHGDLASSFVKTSEMFCGYNPDIYIFGLLAGDDIEDYKKNIESILKSNENYLILTDLLGGSPNNIANILSLKRKNIKIISGINLSLLIEAISNMGTEKLTDEYVRSLINIAKENIKYNKIGE